MMVPKFSASWAFVTQILSFSSATTPKCKAIPGTSSWPSEADWNALNKTLNGHLIHPTPPGAVCHVTNPEYNATACNITQQLWLTAEYHTEQPASNLWQNFNNDTCLPLSNASVPCSPKGYPVYVVNATSAQDIKAGVDFAREHNVRLIVKSTGHDYLGRSSAPNSLSIWTHNLKSLEINEKSFTPQGCKFSIPGASLTAGSGSQFMDINTAVHAKNLTVLSGGAGSVSIGGYLTGGGHAILSPRWGMAADNILEFELVTPGGKIIKVNECQNQDLFWAMRGGGGSTFAVMVSATMIARPAPKILAFTVQTAAHANSTTFWPFIGEFFSKAHVLEDAGISGYHFIARDYAVPGLSYNVNALAGIFMVPLIPPTSKNTTDEFSAIINNLLTTSLAKFDKENYFSSNTSATFPDFYSWYLLNNGPPDAGYDMIIGSRILSRAHVSNASRTATALEGFIANGGAATLHMVAGPGVHNAKPRGGSDAVNPAWRKAFVHVTNEAVFPALNLTARRNAERLLRDVEVPFLERLAPDSGAYCNEANYGTPNHGKVFWGTNYERLVKIKREHDPTDVLWCGPCAGSERWEEVDGVLCRRG